MTREEVNAGKSPWTNREVFEAAQSLADPAQLESLLDRAAAGDGQRRAFLRRLIEAARSDQGNLLYQAVRMAACRSLASAMRIAWNRRLTLKLFLAETEELIKSQ